MDSLITTAIETAPNPLQHSSAATQFIQSYWQKKPAVIRQALNVDAAAASATPEVMQSLACSPDVESRLVRFRDGHYQLDHGPFEAHALPALAKANWSLLIQGMDLHCDALAQLRDRFRFAGDVRLDDVMVSLASDGGGVGPHVDSYDVFLIQLHGKRRWQLAPPGPTRWREDQPLRILEQFEPGYDYTLEPGDMLYLPAAWQHDGTGRGQCVTASVGFRLPSTQELQVSWLHDQADAILAQSEATLADDPTSHPGTAPDSGHASIADSISATQARRIRAHPAELPKGLITSMLQALEQNAPTRDDKIDFLGRMLTEAKPDTVFETPSQRALAGFSSQLSRQGIALDRRTRIAYIEQTLFLNGDSFSVSGATRELLAQLADRRFLSARDTNALLDDPDVGEALADWAAQGWLHLHQNKT